MAAVDRMHSTFLLDAPLLLVEESNVYSCFLENALSKGGQDLVDLLCSIPCLSPASYGPLVALSALLCALPGPWPILELQLAYWKVWKTLPEEAKSGRASPHAQQMLDRTLRQCKQCYRSLVDLLHPFSTAAALIDPETGLSLSHDALAASIRDFKLPISTTLGKSKPVVAISLPNGPLLAMTVLATATYYTAAPLAHGNGVGPEQFKSDVLQSRSNMVLASPADVARLGLRKAWLEYEDIKVALRWRVRHQIMPMIRQFYFSPLALPARRSLCL